MSTAPTPSQEVDNWLKAAETAANLISRAAHAYGSRQNLALIQAWVAAVRTAEEGILAAPSGKDERKAGELPRVARVKNPYRHRGEVVRFTATQRVAGALHDATRFPTRVVAALERAPDVISILENPTPRDPSPADSPSQPDASGGTVLHPEDVVRDVTFEDRKQDAHRLKRSAHRVAEKLSGSRKKDETPAGAQPLIQGHGDSEADPALASGHTDLRTDSVGKVGNADDERSSSETAPAGPNHHLYAAMSKVRRMVTDSPEDGSKIPDQWAEALEIITTSQAMNSGYLSSDRWKHRSPWYRVIARSYGAKDPDDITSDQIRVWSHFVTTEFLAVARADRRLENYEIKLASLFPADREKQAIDPAELARLESMTVLTESARVAARALAFAAAAAVVIATPLIGLDAANVIDPTAILDRLVASITD